MFERERVRRLLGVAAEAVAGGAGRDPGHHLGHHPVGTDLVPHRRGDGMDEIPFMRVRRPVALLADREMPPPLGRVLVRRQAELLGAQAMAPRVLGRARLALGRLRTAPGCGRGGCGEGHHGCFLRYRGAGDQHSMSRNILQ